MSNLRPCNVVAVWENHNGMSEPSYYIYHLAGYVEAYSIRDDVVADDLVIIHRNFIPELRLQRLQKTLDGILEQKKVKEYNNDGPDAA